MYSSLKRCLVDFRLYIYYLFWTTCCKLGIMYSSLNRIRFDRKKLPTCHKSVITSYYLYQLDPKKSLIATLTAWWRLLPAHSCRNRRSLDHNASLLYLNRNLLLVCRNSLLYLTIILFCLYINHQLIHVKTISLWIKRPLIKLLLSLDDFEQIRSQ